MVVVDKEEETSRPGPEIMDILRQRLQSVGGILQVGATAAVVGFGEVFVKGGCL